MMECSVRFVYETNGKGEQVAGIKPALCVRGKKNALAVINDDLWVRTIELTLQDHDKANYVLYHGEPYNPKAFADRFLMSAKSANKPITRRAKHLLTVREQADEDNLPQEILEKDLEQERIYAENTPKERQRAAQKPSPVKDVTKEYEGKVFAPAGPQLCTFCQKPESDRIHQPLPAMKNGHPFNYDPAETSDDALKLAKEARKPPKKVTRVDVSKAHEKARKAIAPPVKAKAKTNGNGKPAAERGTLIKKLAAELKMDAFELRVLIRSTGMRAPYDDEKKVRAAIKQGQKNLKVVRK
jgi:hypothetical protein